MIGIVSYGFYIPKYRITSKEIAEFHRKNPKNIIRSLNVEEKAVAGRDEDVLTMAYESASMALNDISLNKNDIGGVFVGSENHPYVVNPTSTILSEYLDIGHEHLAYDTQFACKAATGALISGISLIKSDYCRYVLVSGSDKVVGKPGDMLEYSSASGSVSFLLGKKNVILEYIDAVSYSTDTPDFWRREGSVYPKHGGRFTGKPGYYHHISRAVTSLFKKTSTNPQSFNHVVFHMPNGIFPVRVAQSLGFTNKQYKHSLIVDQLGNFYSASALMGLCSTLDHVKEGDNILLASYGSGAGSDAFFFKATKNIQGNKKKFSTHAKDNEYIDYATYLKFMGTL